MIANGRKSQVSKAVLELRDLILSGEFEANARVPEIKLAERLGVSRTPLRQAMEQLINEGLLERIETGGCRVASFSIQDVFDAIELRGVMEGTAARFAAERGARPEQLKEAEALLKRIDTTLAVSGVDFEGYVDLNARFHALIWEASASRLLQRELEIVAQRLLSSPSAFLQSQSVVSDFQASLVVAQTHHRSIFDAIKKREGSRAEALMREHARLARHNLEFVLRDKPHLVEQVPGLSLVANA